MAGGSMMSGATPSSTPQHNQEPPRGNHLCNQKTVERAYSLHRGKMERSASTTSFGVPPRQYEFLDSKISKNYKAQFEGRRTMKENQQLLAKLNTIHDEAVRRRLERQERARPSGPPLNRLKRAHRARAADQISRENVQILKRLQMLKPNYSAKSFARSRRREEKGAPAEEGEAAAPTAPQVMCAAYKSFVVKGIGVVQCDVEAKACEPFNILTQLTISCLDEARDVIAERAITISEATLEYGGSEYIAKTDWDDAFDLQELLLKMFQESDDNGNGSLSYDEFYQLMEDADLGLNHSELQLLMSEADENDDQEINYNEFMPVAIDLIQSFKARRYAKRTLDAEDKAVDDEALEKLYGPEIEQSVEAAEALFLLADSRSTGCLTRPEFRRRLKESALNLTRSEQNMIMATMPVDAFSKIVYAKFKDVLYKVKYNSIRNAIVEAKATDTAKLLLDLCREQEQIKMDLDAANSGHVNLEDGEEPAYVGTITAKQLLTVLGSPKLGLSKLQITSVMSDARMTDSMVDYWKFVPVASKTIERMLDPSVMETKIDILSKGLLSQEKVMGGKSEGELAKELNQLFDAYDLDESGQLDPQEFAMCLESLDLGIDRGQIDALLVVADADNSGLVDRKEFMAFTFKHLVHLMKERHLSKLHADIDHAAKHEALDGASDDDDDAPGRVDAHAFDGLLSPQLTAELAGEQINLMEMFRRADVNQEGFLGTTEFHRMLEAMDLGLTQYQMARLMAEADENEDGVISYAEFVPVMLRFLQTYQTKQQANIDWEEREAKAKNLAFEDQHLKRQGLEESIHVVEHAFREAAKLEASIAGGAGVGSVVEIGGERKSMSSYPRLGRGAFLRCLAVPRANLGTKMINVIAARMRPSDLDDLTPTTRFKDVVFECHLATSKRAILEQLPASSLELHVRQILGEQEKVWRRDAGEFDEDSYPGALPARDVYRALYAAKHLHLNRQQLLAVMSLQDQCTISPEAVAERLPPPRPASPGSPARSSASGGSGESPKRAKPAGDDAAGDHDAEKMIDLLRFAAEASTMIADFFDVAKLKRRSSLANSVKTQSISLLKGARADDLEELLTAAFRRFDAGDTGTITPDDFNAVIRSITVLDLSRGEISAVLTHAPCDEDGLILWEDFLLDSQEIFMMLAQERQMKHLSELHDKQFDVNGDVQPLDRAQVERLCGDLVNCATLELDPDDDERLVLGFVPFAQAPPSADGKRPESADGAKASLVSQMSGIKKALNDGADGHDPWKKGEPMHKDGRDVAVAPLDVDLKPLDLHNKKQVPLRKPLLITITKVDRNIAIACEGDDGATFEATMKLPSLALVDLDAGLGFVQRVASKIRVQRDAAGKETLRIR
ncbi:hypothetical protein SO694_00015492 [Aureococcus anophagefferens]|uniref:EF-hand domain-containing protein n=2 Tax=Aureococcus anophagefferens TaxID=44056 RepID=A0ABR1G3P1_AURAN